jgi:hypothetical protein
VRLTGLHGIDCGSLLQTRISPIEYKFLFNAELTSTEVFGSAIGLSIELGNLKFRSGLEIQTISVLEHQNVPPRSDCRIF